MIDTPRILSVTMIMRIKIKLVMLLIVYLELVHTNRVIIHIIVSSIYNRIKILFFFRFINKKEIKVNMVNNIMFDIIIQSK